MSSSRNAASEQALQTNQALAEAYYNIAIPGLSARLGSINAALAQGGEPDYLKQAYTGQRAGLTEGIVGQEKGAITSQLAGTKQARTGGNVMSGMSTGDIGAALANALYGSKFQEAQGSIDQTMNLMSMALGGAGTAGSGALAASSNQLQAIGYMPNYNPTYANVAGGLAGAAGIYGTGLNAGLWGQQSPQLQPLPTATNYPTTIVGGAGGNG
jgi:hypothetical protein